MIYRTGKKTKDPYPMKKLLFKTSIDNGKSISIPFTILNDQKRIAITFIDKFGHESTPINLPLNQQKPTK